MPRSLLRLGPVFVTCTTSRTRHRLSVPRVTLPVTHVEAQLRRIAQDVLLELSWTEEPILVLVRLGRLQHPTLGTAPPVMVPALPAPLQPQMGVKRVTLMPLWLLHLDPVYVTLSIIRTLPLPPALPATLPAMRVQELMRINAVGALRERLWTAQLILVAALRDISQHLTPDTVPPVMDTARRVPAQLLMAV